MPSTQADKTTQPDVQQTTPNLRWVSADAFCVVSLQSWSPCWRHSGPASTLENLAFNRGRGSWVLSRNATRHLSSRWVESVGVWCCSHIDCGQRGVAGSDTSITVTTQVWCVWLTMCCRCLHCVLWLAGCTTAAAGVHAAAVARHSG